MQDCTSWASCSLRMSKRLSMPVLLQEHGVPVSSDWAMLSSTSSQPITKARRMSPVGFSLYFWNTSW